MMGTVFKVLDKTLTAVVGAGMTISLIGSINYYVNTGHESAMRTEYERRLKTKVEAYEEHFEGDKYNLITLTNVIAEEQLERPFELELRLIPDDFLKAHVIDQLDKIIGTKKSGTYNGGNHVAMPQDVFMSALHHEIKHLKTKQVVKEHPEFKERWLELTVDEDGKSLYYGDGYNFKQKFVFLHKFREDYDYEKNLELGFTSDHGREIFDEDVAELCEDIETSFWVTTELPFDDFLTDSTKDTRRIRQKIGLAEEYGLVPSGFIEYVNLKKQTSAIWEVPDWKPNLKNSRAERYLEMTDKFISEHPQNPYLNELRMRRATVHFNLEIYDKAERYIKAIREYEACLTSPYKNYEIMQSVLHELSKSYMYLGDERKSEIYNEAANMYDTYDNILKLVLDGPLPFLAEKGIVLER